MFANLWSYGYLGSSNDTSVANGTNGTSAFNGAISRLFIGTASGVFRCAPATSLTNAQLQGFSLLDQAWYQRGQIYFKELKHGLIQAEP